MGDFFVPFSRFIYCIEYSTEAIQSDNLVKIHICHQSRFCSFLRDGLIDLTLSF